ncbi:MAG TPA: MlaD family protein [Solirubrobacteraceae bacterium]
MTTEIAWWKTRRAAAGGALGVVAVLLVVLLATSAGGSGSGYRVRAIFDNAGNVIPGEQVKVAGVTVGKIGSVEPTSYGKAAVELDIETAGFQDFREDASCVVRPQSLIGEKFVDCIPTQPRVEDTPLPPPLKVVSHGHPGEGERELPVQKTSSPVDADLLHAITRLPEAERLRIILNELGATFAGRGSDLHEVVERADPVLQETTKVLHILASENHVLVNLAEESDKALQPLAAVRREVSDFITQSNTVAKASALHRGALARNFADFPAFLEQLGPAMDRLGKLADQTTPTFTNLGVAAPGINKTFTHLGPFSESSNKFFKSFGSTAKVSGPALKAAEPLFGDLQSLGASAKPFAANFAELFKSLRETGGVERLLDFIFVGAGASNGYDSLGHFLRAEVLANACETYALTNSAGCNANFVNQSATAASASSARVSSTPNLSTTSLVMDRTLAVLKGATPAQAIKEFPGSTSEVGASSLAEVRNAAGLAESGGPTAHPVGGASSGTTYYTPTEENQGASGALLNYLLGN